MNMLEWCQKNTQASDAKECFCIGPQNGEPLCPCRMKSVKIVDGRYVQTIDHGSAPRKDPTP